MWICDCEIECDGYYQVRFYEHRFWFMAQLRRLIVHTKYRHYNVETQIYWSKP